MPQAVRSWEGQKREVPKASAGSIYPSTHQGREEDTALLGRSPQMYPACLPPTSRLVNALLPFIHFDTSPATAWSPFKSQMRCAFPQEAVPHSLRDYMPFCWVPKRPCTCLIIACHTMLLSLR